MGLDGQVRVKTREIENVFFFTSRTITSPLFRRDTRNLHCSVLQAYSAGKIWENIRGSWGHDLLLSNISSNLIPRVNSGTRLDFHFDHQKLMKT